MDRMHRAQYILHTYTYDDDFKKVNYLTIISISNSSFDDGTKSAWSADH